MESEFENIDKCDRCGERVTTKTTVHLDFNDFDEIVEDGFDTNYKCGHCGFAVEWGSPYGELHDHIDHRAEAAKQKGQLVGFAENQT